jgi:hypothetical protein
MLCRGAYYAVKFGLAYSTIFSTQIHHQNITIFYIHKTLHLILFFLWNESINYYFQIINSGYPILNVIVSD